MRTGTRGWFAANAAAVLAFGAHAGVPSALADPELPPPPPVAQQESADAAPQFGPGPHNVVYRARVDGVSRGASITYKLSDTEFNTADPTMVPGRTFEATGVISDPQQAGMQVSIQWPYSASLHCDILVDDQIVAQADQFVAPRFTPQRNDPGYGVLSCGSVTNFPLGNTASVDTPGVEAPAPVDAAPPPPVT
ncbi:hypothetical protein [Mycolicibacterium sediminis]|uniref:Uncharacterized protein n=1 Tax=Mycolicibacterium sediminis TaxID=1286180 RepID=A0A7I7QU48_9MYCO|nr:hypothetical protein [Mycolicibacterium sediminis]BBY29854.1 hypothetical protein MSEDJ_39500 [Mycolicibacterium sediminis]